MAIKIGSSSIVKMFLGSTAVATVYLGSTLYFNSAFSFEITGGEDLNINTLALDAGWNGADDLTATVTGEVTSSVATVVALDGSTLPSDISLLLITQNYIRGAGGQGAIGQHANGSGPYLAADGGNAIRLGCDTIIINANGYIWAGGGGGGGGSSRLISISEDGGAKAGCQTTSSPFPGCSGGGGAGNNAGPGGASQPLAAAGSSGTTSTGGAGGTKSTVEGNCPPNTAERNAGGAGGDPGEVGSQGGGSGSLGGAAGLAIDQNGFTATFLSGNTTERVKGAVT